MRLPGNALDAETPATPPGSVLWEEEDEEVAGEEEEASEAVVEAGEGASVEVEEVVDISLGEVEAEAVAGSRVESFNNHFS